MSKKKESTSERQIHIAKLKAMYESGDIDQVLIPDDANVDRLIEDVVSGTSEPERRLSEMLKAPKSDG